MKSLAAPARVTSVPPGVAGAVELSQHGIDGADFSNALGRRTALLFGDQLMQRVAKRRAQANLEASHVRDLSSAQ